MLEIELLGVIEGSETQRQIQDTHLSQVRNRAK